MFYQQKYKNTKVYVDGMKFDSKAESLYYLELKTKKSIGVIKDFEPQPKTYLSKANILYKPDFKIINNDDSFYYVDVKGMQTPVFKLKLRLWKAYKEEKLILVKIYKNTFKIIYEVN